MGTRNRIADTHPELARQLHGALNAGVDVAGLGPSSHRVVWWLCEAGHEWQAQVRARTRGSGCPKCRDLRRSSVGEAAPHLMSEIHPDRNAGVDVAGLSSGSSKTVWWRCPNGHEWSTEARQRARGGSGCAQCQRLGTVAELYPDLVKEIHPLLNSDLVVADLSAGSTRRVWWRCSSGHEWEAKVTDRCRSGTGCARCLRLGSVAQLHPELLLEAHPNRNDATVVADLSAGSSQNVWWQCADGHEWQASVNSRRQGTGCPSCWGLFSATVAHTHPHLLNEVDTRRSPNIDVATLTAGSTQRVWWKCERGHSWETPLGERTRGAGCLTCARIDYRQYNSSLDVTHPVLAAEWSSRNLDRPSVYTAGSGSRVWWQCDQGHHWRTAINTRTKGSGCPTCGGLYDQPLRLSHPDLVQRWHHGRNSHLDLTTITAGSSETAWWQCEHGHEWQRAVLGEVKAHGCARCNTQYLLVDKQPGLRSEWHRRNSTAFDDATAGSGKLVWWQCARGHEWQRRIIERAHGHGACPEC